MRLRPFLTSAALVTGLLATSAHSSAAWAQKAAVLSPVTPWALTKVDDTEGKGGAYCAMARRFGHNSILTFARNEGAEASLALDFQSPKLATGENMKVILDPGAGEQRSYYISPISEQAFVVRLGRDDKFFSALATTGLLRIEAAGQSYSFNLSDIDAGQSRLVSCLTSGGQENLQQASADGGGDIHQELESLRRDVQSLKKENGRLSSLGARTGSDDFDASIQEDLTSQADSLEQENSQLRGPTGLSAGQEPEQRPAINHLTQENHRLQNELAALSLGGQGAVAVHEKISSLEQQNMALKTDLSKGPDTQEWKKNRADLFALKEENRRLQDMLAEKSGSFAMVENLESQVQSLQSENSKLMRTTMDDTAQRMQAITPAAGNDAGPMEGAAPEGAPPAPVAAPPAAEAPTPPPEALIPPTPVAEDPQKQIETLMGQLRDKDAKLVEMSNLTTERDALKTKNAELEQKLLESAKDKDTIAALNEKVRALEEENAALKKQGGGESSDKIAALTKENAALKKQIEELKSAPAAQASASGPEGATCTAAVAKAREESDVASQAEMQGLAKENMRLKEKLAQVTGAPAPQQEAIKEEDESAMTPEPVQEERHASAPPPESGRPAPVQEVIVSAPPEVQGATEAQMQEAEMMHSMDQPRGASPQQAKASEAINWNQDTPDISAPPPMESPVQELAPAPAPAPEPAAGMSGFSIKDVLISAQIAAPGQIQKVEKASLQGRTAYQWHSGAVYGSAEQRPMTDASQFDAEVSQYLAKTKKRCPGDFASSPDDHMQNGPDRIASYEIACVAKNINSSASLLFIDKAGTFTVVAHETSADKMDDAMTLRDKVMKTLTGQ